MQQRETLLRDIEIIVETPSKISDVEIAQRMKFPYEDFVVKRQACSNAKRLDLRENFSVRNLTQKSYVGQDASLRFASVENSQKVSQK